MRCKPGDLAIIVRDGLSGRNLGKLVTVIDRQRCDGDEWRCESDCILFGEDLRTGDIRQVRKGECFWANDCDLRPIRDPGDDARDEMLRPLPTEVAA